MAKGTHFDMQLLEASQFLKRKNLFLLLYNKFTGLSSLISLAVTSISNFLKKETSKNIVLMS